MTDRLKGAWVSFDQDYRDDDVVNIVLALKMIKGVSGVRLELSDPADWMARDRVKREIGDKIFDLVRDLSK